MHPEIQQESKGLCPKCGMQLVLKEKTATIVHHTDDKGLGVLSWKNYLPLAVIITLIFTVSGIVSWSAGILNIVHFITYFMASFFIVFSGFKLMDLKGFAEGYSTYDLLAQRWFGYGYIYPFIELGFGLAMLTSLMNPALLWVEFVVMAFSGVGVAIKLAKGEKFQCVCLGTVLKVPLTRITLIEDFGMALLALVLLFLTL